jgi:hypothetical protein
MNKALLLASVLATAVTAIHVIAGGNDVAAPLLASQLAEGVRLTLYAVWHMASVLLGASALTLGWAALPGRSAPAESAVRLVALLWVASGIAFLVVGITQPGDGLLLKLPQWLLLIPVGVLAWLGANNSSKPTPLRGAA